MQFLLYGEWDATYPNDPNAATAVAIEFENGTRVLRIRKDSQTQAAIIRDGETTKFKSFGATIPGIHALINARPIEIGPKSVNLNFSLQDDPSFMLSEARPVKAQWIGRLYGAHVINQMLREMAKDKKNADSRRRDAEDDLKELEAELASYRSIEDQEAILGQAEALLGSYSFLKECQQEAYTIDVLRESLDRDKWVADIDTGEMKAALEQLSALTLVRTECLEYIRHKTLLKKASKAMTVNAKELKGQVETLAELTQIKEDLEHIGVIKTQQDVAHHDARVQMDAAQGNLRKAVFSGNKCPVCNAPLDAASHADVICNIANLVGATNEH